MRSHLPANGERSGPGDAGSGGNPSRGRGVGAAGELRWLAAAGRACGLALRAAPPFSPQSLGRMAPAGGGGAPREGAGPARAGCWAAAGNNSEEPEPRGSAAAAVAHEPGR